MRKYANPADEERIQAAIARVVCSGKSIVLNDQGHLPPGFRAYSAGEVAMCASDMIANGLLIQVGEDEKSVLVINASNGCNPSRVIAAKGLHSLHRDISNPLPSFWERNRDAIWVHVIKHLLSALVGGLVAWLLK